MADELSVGGPTGNGATQATLFSRSRAPALALIDGRGEVVRLTETFRAEFAPDGSRPLSIWDFLPDPDERLRLGRVLEGRLLRADLALPSPAGSVAAQAEAVLDAAVMRHALLTVARSGADGDPRSGADVLLEDRSLEDSPAIVWIKDLSGRYLRISRRYTERLGIDEETIKGKTDAELAPAHIVGEPRSLGRASGGEPVQLEYPAEAVGGREALTVLRFPIHGLGGAAVAVCGVAASVIDAAIARSEAERLLRMERWAGLSATAIRAELIQEWELAELGDLADSAPPRVPAPASANLAGGPEAVAVAAAAAGAAELEAGAARLERLRGELAAAAGAAAQMEALLGKERTARGELEARLGEEAARRAELEQAVAAAAQRVEGHVSGLASDRSRITELEAAVDAQRRRADGAERELASIRGRAEAAERELAETRARADGAEREATDQRARADGAEREAGVHLAQAEAARRDLASHRERAVIAERDVADARVRIDELERAHTSMAAEQAEVERSARAEVERSARAEVERSARAEVEHRVEAAQHLAAEAEAAAGLARERAETLEAALTSARAGEAENRAELDRVRAEMANLPGLRPASVRILETQAGAPVSPASGLNWSPSAQLVLTASLARAAEWRTGLKDTLRILGTEGGWDVVIAWCLVERASALRCTAMWMSTPDQLSLFETSTWQRRQSPTASHLGRAAVSQHATWLGDLGTVSDSQLASAASEGMRGALLVPMRHGDESTGALELLTRGTGAPDPDTTSAMEAVALQLAHFEYLLRRGAEPRWRLGRL